MATVYLYMTAGKKKVLSDGCILTVALIISYVIGLFYRILVAGRWGNDGIGQFDKVYYIYNMVYLTASVGIAVSLSKMIKNFSKKKKYKDAQKLFISSMFFWIIVVLLVDVIIYYATNIITNPILNIKDYKIIMIIPLSLVVISGVFRGYFQGNGAVFVSGFSLVLESFVGVLTSIILVLKNKKAYKMGGYKCIMQAGVKGITVGVSVSLLFLIFIYIINRSFIYKRIKRNEFKNKEDENFYRKQKRHIKECMSFIKKMIGSSKYVVFIIMIWNIIDITDKLLFNKLLCYCTLDKKVLLGINVKIILLLNIIVFITVYISNKFLVCIRLEMIRKNYAKIRKYLNMTLRYSNIIVIPITFMLVVISKRLVNFLNKNEAINVVIPKVLVVATVATIFCTLAIIGNEMLYRMNLRSILLKNIIFAYFVRFIVDIVMLLGDMKIHSLSVSYFMFSFILCLLNGYYVIKEVKYKINVIKVAIIPIASGFIMSLIASLTMNLTYILIKRNSLSILFGVLAGVFAYFVSIVILGGISEDELSSLSKRKRLLKISKKMHLI